MISGVRRNLSRRGFKSKTRLLEEVLVIGQNFFKHIFEIRVSLLHFLERLTVNFFFLTVNAIIKYQKIFSRVKHTDIVLCLN